MLWSMGKAALQRQLGHTHGICTNTLYLAGALESSLP